MSFRQGPSSGDEEAKEGLECDGIGKYVAPGTDPEKAIAAEKRRELALRYEGWTVHRVLWSHLDSAAYLRRLLGR
ncbi:hypothetical protein [Sediminivirga luteola]|uniref:DUF559 domain-containing protein n=1 Tax=Sediminivirga luteola TaxID=1774748 RepID=A0A8J2TXX0_9MICO|nr:hypothetical protein [Sediminivirga luteola]MCI2265805.1 hypothetical protein [Sediminivirga luteola]GGA14493.1 hypothetical protein GCM10011333_16770 [Sediminivirga luteola]